MTANGALERDLGAGRETFDYEEKTWGAHEVGIAPTFLGALRLRYCLSDLEVIQGQVLEVGCGAGAMARAIKRYRPDLEVFGCDISRTAIDLASSNSGGVDFRQGDAYRLPFDSEKFQAVIMFDVLEHLNSPSTALGEISRVLESGGLFHLYSPCEGELHSLHGLLDRLGWAAKEDYGGHIQRFTLGTLSRLAIEHDFEVGRTRWSGHLLNQLVDVAYFTLLSVRGKNTNSSVEGYLAEATPSLISRAVSAAKVAVAIGSFIESRPVPWLPGAGIHMSMFRRAASVGREPSASAQHA